MSSQVQIPTGGPDELARPAERRDTRRLRIAGHPRIRVGILLVEQRNDPVDDIEGELSQPLELLAREGGGKMAATVWVG